MIFARESRFAEKLAEKDATLWDKIKQLVMDAIKKLQAVIRGIPQDGISEHLVGHLEELAESFDEMMADALYQAGYGTAEESDFFANAMEKGAKKEKPQTDGDVQLQERRISIGMSEQERYELLKDRTVVSKEIHKEKISQYDEKYCENILDLIGSLTVTQRKKILRKFGDEFNIFKLYHNSDLDIVFRFSKGGVKECSNKQKDDYARLVKLFSCFDDVIDNAIGIEAHNRNEQGYKRDDTLKTIYVLVSSFVDGGDVYPVKLEIKEFFDKENILYVAIALNSIKKDEVVMEGEPIKGVTQATRSSDAEVVTQEVVKDDVAQQYARSTNISIAQLLSKINPRDKSFIKYIPDGFLDAERLEVKRKAIEEDVQNAQEDDTQEQYRRVYATTSDRQILAKAVDNIVQSDADYEIARKYKEKLASYREMQSEIDFLTAEINDLFAVDRGDWDVRDRERLDVAMSRRQVLREELKKADSALLGMEALAPLRSLVSQERARANRAERRLERQEKKTKEALATQKERLETKRKESLEKQKEQLEAAQAEKKRKAQERALRVQYLARAERAISRLYRWTANPTKKEHVPTALLPYVKSLFEAVEVSHRFAQIERLEEQLAAVNDRIYELQYMRADASVIAAQEAYKIDLVERIKKLEGTQHNVTWADRLDVLKNIISSVEADQNASQVYVDFARGLAEDIQRRVDTFTDKFHVRLFDAKPEDIRFYAEALESITHSITEAGRLYANKRAAKVETLAEQSIEAFRHDKRDAARAQFLELPRRMYGLEALNPAYFGHKLGAGAEAVMDELYDGFYRVIANVRVIDEFADKLRRDYKVSEYTGKNQQIHRIRLKRGGSVSLTTGQLMTVLALSDRPQAQKHMFGRGIQSFRGNLQEALAKTRPLRERVADETKRLVGKGETDVSEFAKLLFGSIDVHRVTQADIDTMIGLLTSEQVACVKEIKRFLREDIAAMGNKTTQELYLYDMFTEENYFPIETVATFRAFSEKDKGLGEGSMDARSVFSVLNKGFAKQLQEQAGNPIVIRDIFDVFMEHCFDMANYAGLGPAVSDTIKWLSYRQKVVVDNKITSGMNDQRRYELLKDRVVTAVAPDYGKIKNYDSKNASDILQEIMRGKTADKTKLLKKIGEEFGVFKEYQNADFEISFSFSRGNLSESMHHQKGSRDNYVKLLSCFDQVIANAVGVEAHNRNKSGYNFDAGLKNMFVLVSSFVDGDKVIPVKLEVKEFSDKKNVLYVAISLESIKKDEVMAQEDVYDVAQQYARSSKISIAQLLSKINPRDKSFIKYIPDGFLDAEKREIKRKAVEEDLKKSLGKGADVHQNSDMSEEEDKSVGLNDGTTLRDEMEKAWGRGAERYIRNLLMSLEGELKGTDGAKIINKLVRNAKIASAAGNARVIGLPLRREKKKKRTPRRERGKRCNI